MHKFLVASVAALSGCMASPVMSQEIPCGEYDIVMEQVAEDWEEIPLAFGTSSNGAILQITYNEVTGEYSLLMTNPANGLTCLVDSGDNFTIFPLKPNV